MNINTFLSKRIHQAIIKAGAPITYRVQVNKSTKTKFGDYQVNGIIALAKHLSMSPRKLAENIINFLNLNGIAYKVDVVDPGFINIFLEPKWLARQIAIVLSSERLGIKKVKPQTIVVDYSAPNIAKEMHVGHLRSTIIGDASVRILSFLGHNVIRVNHIGDWGTQLGMLIAYLEEYKNNHKEAIQLQKLNSFYRIAKQCYDENPTFAKRARNCVVKLQNGDEHCRNIWKKLVDITVKQNQKTYELLNVTLTSADVMGESFYNEMLPNIVDDLKARGIAIESEGATVVFLDEFKNKEGNSMGVIIQKKDGAYLYTTTDIACIKYRYEKFKTDRIIYYIDSRQHQHLMQVWAIVRKAGYIPKSVLLEHHMFGMILGKDSKPFKTRDGDTVKLTELLDEALDRAYHLVSTKNPSMKDEELTKLAHVVGIGAIKYYDLSKNRITDYIFNWDNILNLEGNTAPYMQYAYTRIISIFKRSGQNQQQIIGDIFLEEKQEIQLAVCLLQLEETIITAANYGTPHVLCSYLYSLAVLFSSFYKCCPILNAKSFALRQSRLQLSLLTARTLKQGLALLGIETVERM